MFKWITGYSEHFVGVATFLFAAFGAYSGYVSFFHDQPELIVHIDSFELKGLSDLLDVPEKLSSIEQKYGEVTAGKIIALKEMSFGLGKFDTSRVEALLKQVYNTISDFQKPVDPWTVDRITYNYGVVGWPDGTSFNITNDQHAPYIFSDEYKAVISSPEKPGGNVIERIKQKAFLLYKPFGEGKSEKRNAVANGLREVKAILEESKHKTSYYLELSLNVINKSRQQNLAWERGDLTIHLFEMQGDIHLRPRLVESSSLPSIDTKELVFRTDPLGTMDEELRNKILTAFGKNSVITFTLTDLFHKQWSHRVKFFDEQVVYLTDEELNELKKDTLKDLR